MIDWLVAIVAALSAMLYNFSLNVPDAFSPLSQKILLFIFLNSVSVLISRLAGRGLTELMKRRRGTHAPSELIGFSFSAASSLLVLFLTSYKIFDSDLTSLLATSAAVTVAVGFALQATLGNLFEGISVQLNRPFETGDWIEYKGHIGQIESLTWRALKLRQSDNTVLSIPNNVLAKSVIRVISEHLPTIHEVTFSAPVDIEPHRVVTTIERVMVEVQGVLPEPRPVVHVSSLPKIAPVIQYTAKFSIHYSGNESAVLSQMRERIWYGLARAGIEHAGSLQGTSHDFRVPLIRENHEVSRFAKVVTAMRGHHFFDLFSNEQIEILVQGGSKQVYAPSEIIPLKRDGVGLLSVILHGTVDHPDDGGGTEFAAGQNAIEYWTSEQLNEVKNHYIGYIGPAAEELVHLASLKTADLYTLYRLLAEDISDSTQRRAFLATGPLRRSFEMGRNSVFGTLTWSSGIAIGRGKAVSRGSSEVWQIDATILQEMLEREPALAERLLDVLQKSPAVATMRRDEVRRRFNAYMSFLREISAKPIRGQLQKVASIRQ